MKHLYKDLIFTLALAMMTSCASDILDKNPEDTFSSSTFYSTVTECNMGLTGVYNSLRPIATPTFWYQLDFMSDNNYCEDAWQGSKEFGEWIQNSNSWASSARWGQDYRTIARANLFLSSVAEAPIDESVITQMTAEARFLRAYSYADLITFFGDVPLILGTQTLDSANVSRVAKSKVLDAILDDIDYCKIHLPKTYSSDLGRATRGAALALETQILLYNEKWSEAAKAAKEVMDLEVYSLYNDYASLFEEANENNSEVIFDIEYISSVANQPWPSSCLSFTVWPTGNITLDCINSFYMTNGLPITDSDSGYDPQDPYTNRDPRLAASVVLPGSNYKSGIFIPADDTNLTGARPRKYADEHNNDTGDCAINTIIFRYADILLMRAEALIETGSTDQEIYDLIDEVRARVGMQKIEDVEGTGLTTDQLRKILRHERRVEFVMEGTRYKDMLRWKDTTLIHDVYGYVKNNLSNPANASTWKFEENWLEARQFDASKGWLWPIPLDEMETNENLTQNPGY